MLYVICMDLHIKKVGVNLLGNKHILILILIQLAFIWTILDINI